MNRNMPSAKLVREYWADEVCRIKGFSDRREIIENEICFACGLLSHKTERSHIKAGSMGGDNSVENLHMLCYACHVDSEYLYDGAYWVWFSKRTKIDGIISNALRGGYSLNENSAIKWIIDRVDLDEIDWLGVSTSFMVRQKQNERILRRGNGLKGIPFGYKMNNGAMVIDPSQMLIVQEIFLLKSKGMGYEKIAKEITRMFGKREANKKWNAGTIAYIVKNKLYQGIIRR